MKNYWLDLKKNEEIKKIRLEMFHFFNNLMKVMHQGSIIIDWTYINKLKERLKELEGK